MPRPDSPSTRSRRDFLRSSGLLLGGLSVAGALPVSARSRLPEIRSSWTMGTQVHLSLDPDAAEVHVERSVFEQLRRVNDALSAHEPLSALSRLNAEPDTWIDADDDLLQMVTVAGQWSRRTGGAFDVTVLPALRTFGFLPTHPGVLAERINYSKLTANGGRVRIASGYAADFGGIAKGYGVDLGIASLRSAGVTAGLLEAGGDLYAMGRPEADRRWRVGVRDPENPSRLVAVLEIEDEAVATSGTYLQTRPWNGRSVSHLIDPRTGHPVQHVVSATVLAKDACTADLLATATSVLPPAESLDLFASMPGVEGLWIGSDGTATTTPGMRRRLTFA